jgi:hypothetical protein
MDTLALRREPHSRHPEIRRRIPDERCRLRSKGATAPTPWLLLSVTALRTKGIARSPRPASLLCRQHDRATRCGQESKAFVQSAR